MNFKIIFNPLGAIDFPSEYWRHFLQKATEVASQPFKRESSPDLGAINFFAQSSAACQQKSEN